MATSNMVERLMDLKKEIDQAKLEQASLQGMLNQNLKRLKTEFGCSNIDEAKELLDKLNKDKTNLESKIEKAVTELERKYEW